MPSKKSRTAREHKSLVNKPHRTQARSKVAAARIAIANDPDAPETDAAINVAVKSLARAAQKGVIHPNNAARRTSRLMKARARAIAE